MRIDNGDPGVAESLLHGRGRRLAVPQLFPDALKNQHIRIHAHTHRQDHAGNPRQRQHRSEVAHEAKQDDQVQNQRNIGIYAGPAVIDQHKDKDGEHAIDGGPHSGTNRIGAERWPDRTLFQVLDARRQSA